MKLLIEKDIKLNDYYVTFDIIDITNVEEELLSDFGKIKVEVGKEIPLANGSFRLGSEEKYLPANFPFTKIFKNITYGLDTKEYALAYVAEITKRVEGAIADLTSKTDDFSGIEEVQL